MIITTIDGIQREHFGCTAKEDGAWLYVTNAGGWVASYLRCAVRAVNESPSHLDDLMRQFKELFPTGF